MTTILEAQAAVRARFRDLIATPRSLLVHYDNWPEQQPPVAAPWVFLRVVRIASPTVEGGAGLLKRDRGLMTAHIYAPAARGSREANELADAIESAFAAREHSGVRYLDARYEDIGVQAPWYRIKVEVPFDSERVVTA